MRLLGTLALAAFTVFAVAPAFADPAPTDDPYAWLEDIEGKKALDWVRAHNDATLKVLKADPTYETNLAAAQAILTAKDRIPYGSIAGGQVYNFWQDDVHVRGLWRRTTIADYQNAEPKWETLLDLDKLSADQKENWVWKGASCLPPNFTRCLLTLSRGGGDASVVREFDLTTKTFVKGGFDIPEAKSDVTWIDQDTVAIGTDWGPNTLTTSGYPRVVKILKHGQTLKQAVQIFEGKKEDVAASAMVDIGADGKTEIFLTRALDFFNAEIYHYGADKKATRIPLPTSVDFRGMHKRQLLFTLRQAWTEGGANYPQGALVSFSLDAWAANPDKIPAVNLLLAPDERTAIDGVSSSRDAVYVDLLQNVKGRIDEFTFNGDGWAQRKVEMPDNGTVGITSTSDFDGDVLLQYASFLVPDQLYIMQAGGTPKPIKQLPARFTADGYNVQQFEAASADGTKIPYFVVRKGDATLDGKTPTMIYAYGGFEVSTTPWYWSSAGKLWLEQGGAYVIANIRGGGEFGPRWHEAALKENRQRNFDDLAAVSKDVIARKLSSPRHLAIMGGSQGGLLVAATFVQNPDLYNAVVCQVPLGDMLRYTQLSAGASWIAEYGDPADPKMRAIIAKWSPYQNIKAGVKYPKVFFTTSTKDDRVHPGHARKMAAKMEANGQPFYYYENIEGGHSAAANLKQRAEQLALTYVYLRKQLMGEGDAQ